MIARYKNIKIKNKNNNLNKIIKRYSNKIAIRTRISISYNNSKLVNILKDNNY